MSQGVVKKVATIAIVCQILRPLIIADKSAYEPLPPSILWILQACIWLALGCLQIYLLLADLPYTGRLPFMTTLLFYCLSVLGFTAALQIYAAPPASLLYDVALIALAGATCMHHQLANPDVRIFVLVFIVCCVGVAALVIAESFISAYAVLLSLQVACSIVAGLLVITYTPLKGVTVKHRTMRPQHWYERCLTIDVNECRISVTEGFVGFLLYLSWIVWWIQFPFALAISEVGQWTAWLDCVRCIVMLVTGILYYFMPIVVVATRQAGPDDQGVSKLSWLSIASRVVFVTNVLVYILMTRFAPVNPNQRRLNVENPMLKYTDVKSYFRHEVQYSQEIALQHPLIVTPMTFGMHLVLHIGYASGYYKSWSPCLHRTIIPTLCVLQLTNTVRFLEDWGYAFSWGLPLPSTDMFGACGAPDLPTNFCPPYTSFLSIFEILWMLLTPGYLMVLNTLILFRASEHDTFDIFLSGAVSSKSSPLLG